MIRNASFALAFLTAIGAVAGCSSEAEDDFEIPASELAQSPEEVREVIPGPVTRSSDAEVWAVENQWADTNTANARKAGVAWAENSGLSWEQKFQAWTASFEKTAGKSYGETIRFKTPYGKTMDGPVLECADVAIWLRLTFSAWYHLPFYLTGWHDGQTIYMGHFGVVNKEGSPVSGFPRFRSLYPNYEGQWAAGRAWPHDARLRGRHVGPDDDAAGVKIDEQELRSGEGAGAYFDELFLNKRAGYLMTFLDGYFGSVNLADGANMFHIQPEATTTGDALLERFQKEGIGHTLPVVGSRRLESGKLRVTVASGSMPRRQPYWEDESSSANYFKMEETGGRGESYDGTPYAKLGGGIRRWRTPVVLNGRWHNIVPTADRAIYIEDQNLEAIAARPEKFEELLAEESPEAQRDSALRTIENARTTLLTKPASCSQRTKREEAFKQLYDVMETHFGKSKAEVDAEYRTLQDFVFAELEYTQSKTCCWNATTPAMAEIVMDFADKEKAQNDADGVCRQPTAFRATGGGKYDTWKNHAASLGRSAQWAEWSEGEPCAQRGVAEDTITAAGQTQMCSR